MLNSFNYQKSRRRNFRLQIFKKGKSKLYHIENSKLEGKQCVNLDEVAHNGPPHQDRRCLQIHLFLSLVLKRLNCTDVKKPFY